MNHSLRILCIFIIGVTLVVACRPGATQKSDIDKTTMYLIRHAEKADDGTRNPPLDSSGVIRSERIVEMFLNKKIESLYSTDYKRTITTISPLATELGIEIEIYDAGDLESFANSLLSSERRGNSIVSGHSNSTPRLANLLLGHDEFSALSESEYNAVFVVEIEGNQVDVTMSTYDDVFGSN